jgi:hypothetical protein
MIFEDARWSARSVALLAGVGVGVHGLLGRRRDGVYLLLAHVTVGAGCRCQYSVCRLTWRWMDHYDFL